MMFLKIREDEEGSLLPLAIVLITILLLTSILIVEIVRIHSIREHVEDKLYRISNLAIKTAMYDSERNDYSSKLDENIAKTAFYDYLKTDLHLNSSSERIEGDERIYSVKITRIDIDRNSARIHLNVMLSIKPATNLIKVPIKVPIEVVSKDMRLN